MVNNLEEMPTDLDRDVRLELDSEMRQQLSQTLLDLRLFAWLTIVELSPRAFDHLAAIDLAQVHDEHFVLALVRPNRVEGRLDSEPGLDAAHSDPVHPFADALQCDLLELV